jgi:hypothetical protein
LQGKPTAKKPDKLSLCNTYSYNRACQNCFATQRNNYAERRVKMRQLRKPKTLPEQQNIGAGCGKTCPRKTVAYSLRRETHRTPFGDPSADREYSRKHFVCGWADYRGIQEEIPELLQARRLQFWFGQW